MARERRYDEAAGKHNTRRRNCSEWRLERAALAVGQQLGVSSGVHVKAHPQHPFWHPAAVKASGARRLSTVH